MELTLYQYDAFAETPFSGNPAAVVPLSAWLPNATLQSIALENNLSETVFFVPADDGADHDFHIRWFTPTVEVRLCGHATLASGATLFEQLGWSRDEIRFQTNEAGPLTVTRRDDLVELDFPAGPATDAPMPTGISDALGVAPSAYLQAYSGLAVFDSEEQVRSVRPDRDFLLNLDVDGLIVTGPGDDCDCVSRYFAPHAGIDEDPVTGSAHCTIAPYWAQRLGKTSLHARQVSARGGDLYCEVDGDRVRLAGRSRLFMTATIYV